MEPQSPPCTKNLSKPSRSISFLITAATSGVPSPGFSAAEENPVAGQRGADELKHHPMTGPRPTEEPQSRPELHDRAGPAVQQEQRHHLQLLTVRYLRRGDGERV